MAPGGCGMDELRSRALSLLPCANVTEKVFETKQPDRAQLVDGARVFDEPQGIPGRPSRPGAGAAHPARKRCIQSVGIGFTRRQIFDNSAQVKLMMQKTDKFNIGSENRWYALLVFFFVSVFNYLDRTILSILQVPVKQDLGLSDAQMGA